MTVEILNQIPNQDLKDEMMQINVLQVVMVCLSPERFSMAQIFVNNALWVLLRLYESKAKSVVSTAKAALNQLFSHVVNDLIKWTGDNTNEEIKTASDDKMSKSDDSRQFGPNLEVCKSLIKGLVSHLDPKKKSDWPVVASNSTTALALDLMALVISEGKKKLAEFREIMIVLDEAFDPLLNQITSMKNNFIISIRLINWITLFAVYLECGLEPLTSWCITFVNIRANNWQKLIAFEAFALVFNSKSLVKNLSESNEQYCLANIFKVFEQNLASIQEPIYDDIYGQNHPYYQSQRLYKYLEDNNFDNMIPAPDTAVIIKLLIECLYNTSNQFNELYEEMEVEEFKANIFNPTHWNTILNLLNYCLALCTDEINIQMILNTWQNLFCLAGKTSNTKLRSSIINSIGKFALPDSYEKISTKNILVIKKLINISHCLCKYFDSKCWYYMFKILQKVEPLVRDELGLRSVEDSSSLLINDSVRREIDKSLSKGPITGLGRLDKVNQTFAHESGKDIYSGDNPKRKLSEEKKSIKKSIKPETTHKNIQKIRSSKGKRKTVLAKQKSDNPDFDPIGRSKTITGHHRRNVDDEWDEDFLHSDSSKIDLDQIHNSISTLFLTSLKFTDSQIQDMITGLGELIVNTVEELAQPTSGSGKKKSSLASRMVSKPKKNLFSIRKMTEIALVNIFRVDKFWQIIIDQLTVISVCNNEDFRALSIHAFTIIIIEVLQKHESEEIANFKGKIDKAFKNQPKPEIKKSIVTKTEAKIPIKEVECNVSMEIDEMVTPSGRDLMKRVRLDSDCWANSEENEEVIDTDLPDGEKLEWNDERWQIKVFKPFLDSLCSASYEVDQMLIITQLENILLKCFHTINEEGWRILIISLSKINFARIPDNIFCKVYDLLELISTDFIMYLGNENLKILITGVRRFATHHQGVFEFDPANSEYELCCQSSRIFVKIADFLDKASEGLSETSDDQKRNPELEDLWKCLFNELKAFFQEIQYSMVIRKSTLQALKQILESNHLPFELWEYALDNMVLGMFDKSVGKYIQQLVGFSTSKAREVKQHETSQAMTTPTFSLGGGGGGGSQKQGKKGQGRRMKFDEESIQKFHQRSDHDNKATEFGGFGIPPEETPKTKKPTQQSIDDQSICILMMNIFNEALQNYNNMFEVLDDEENNRNVLELWILYVKIMSPLINNASAEILKGVLKTIDFMINSSLCAYFYSKYDDVALSIFEDINSVIQRKTDLVLTIEVTELLVKIYKQIFKKENIEERPMLLNPQNLSVTLHILRVNLINARPTIGLNAMRQDHDLKAEEKQIFNFIEYLGELLHDNDEALKYYLSFLLNFISYDANEPHYEMFVRRTFVIISLGIVKDSYSLDILHDLIPELYEKTCDIIDLRYHNNSCMSLVFSMKASSSLFESAGMFLLQVTAHLLDKDSEELPQFSLSDQDSMKKPNLTIDIPEYEEDEESKENEESATEISNINEKDSDEEIQLAQQTKHKDTGFKSQLGAIDEEDSVLLSPSKKRTEEISLQTVQDTILNKIMDLLKDTMLFDISKIEKHNKAVKDAVIKSSQDLDVQVINFIINSLLPHSHKLGKKFEHTLVSIIDKGWNGYLDAMSTSGLNMFGSSSTVLAQSNSLSTYCFDNLFELWSYKNSNKSTEHMKESKRQKLDEIRRKIAKTTTPILIDRCKDTLTKFLHDEMRSGSMLMSQQRAEEVVFIMQKLQNLQVYPNLLNELIRTGSPNSEDSDEDNKKFKKYENVKLTEDQLEARKHCLSGGKGHLFYFIPLFSEFLNSKEEIIKEALKDLFIEMALSQGIHGNMTFLSGSGNGEFSGMFGDK